MKAKLKEKRHAEFPPTGLGAVKRAVNIFLRGILGLYSPSLERRIRVSDIWKTKNYLGGSSFFKKKKFRCRERGGTFRG